MKNLLATIGLCLGIATSAAMSACVLYVDDSGNNGNSGTSEYCDNTGCYTCDQSGQCYCVDNTCTGSGSGSGYTCSNDNQCAQGCYCDTDPTSPTDGTCQESGFCTTDAECTGGLKCDVSRNTCNPTGTPPAACQADSDCSTGFTCDTSTGQCVGQWTCQSDYDCGVGFSCQAGVCAPATCDTNDNCAPGSVCPAQGASCTTTCSCLTDADAIAGGYSYCDETRDTCMSGTNPDPGSCNGAVSTTETPTCPAGQVPLIRDGAYTGACTPIASCDVPPPCEVLNTESDCLAQAGTCSPSYTGMDCTAPDGSACVAGESNCSCASFTYASCSTDTAPSGGDGGGSGSGSGSATPVLN